MTEQRFDELTNLYLDNEIGRSELGELKHAIKENILRRRKFERACEVHQAARKALSATPTKTANAQQPAPNLSPPPGGRSPSAGWRIARSAKSSSRSRQEQAHRNATVGVLAERQEKQGSASSVNLNSIDIESRSNRRSSRKEHSPTFSFFDSPLGIVIGLILTLVGAGCIYLVMQAAAPATDDDPASSIAGSPIAHLDGGYDPKVAAQLAAEINRHKAAADAEDSMSARLYQSTFTGQASSNQTTVDYFSSHLDAATADNTSGNASGSVPPSTESVAPAISAKSDGSNAAPAAQP